MRILADRLGRMSAQGETPSFDQMLTVARQRVLDTILERNREAHEAIAQHLDVTLAEGQARLGDAVNSPAYQTGRLHGLGDALAESYERLPYAELEQAVQNPDVRDMIETLRSGPKTNSELARILGQDDAVISRKLGRLDGAGVVTRIRQGRHMLNSLSPAALAVLEHSVAGGHRMPVAPHPDAGIGGGGNVVPLVALRRAA